MKSPFVFALALLVAGTVGCAQFESRPGARRATRAVTLAVTVNGRDRPSATQLAAVRRALAPVLAAENWTLADGSTRSVDLLRVDISPSADDPDGVGIVTVIGFGLNPLTALASRDSRVIYSRSDDRYNRIYDPYYDRNRTYDRPVYDQPSYSGGGSSGGGGSYNPPPPSSPPPSSPPPTYSNSSNEGRSWGAGATYSAPSPAPSPSADSGGGRSWGAGAATPPPPPPPPPPPAETTTTTPAT